MKKKRRIKRAETGIPVSGMTTPTWVGADGLRAMLPGVGPTSDMLEQMTRQYQERIRNSPLWDEMVQKFGVAEAEQLLKEFRVQPG